jgi:prepilin-type N-terminal cleavage/methylation domain-containing protein
MNTMQKSRFQRAFTMIELLVVVTILMLLAGIILPGVMAGIRAAEKAQARSDCNSIVEAVKLYYGEYGNLPITSSAEFTTTNTGTGGDFLKRLAATNNVRRIAFIDIAKERMTTNSSGITSMHDPWGRPYHVRLNQDTDDPSKTISVGGEQVAALAAAWSYGPDGDAGKTNRWICSWR